MLVEPMGVWRVVPCVRSGLDRALSFVLCFTLAIGEIHKYVRTHWCAEYLLIHHDEDYL